ncbi:MAG: Sapep family Mn(2+)-dependent dipeptidase [Firmicutes bacterium]|nr:Sapep family Mn(2+)-dependent dipeptidase [Bacillota bacterium]
MSEFILDTARLDRLIADSASALERDLLELVSCPSVEGPAEPGAPFGPGVAQALDCGLRICRKLGLEAHDVDGYCGYADLQGAEAEQVGVLAHLDVVPARAEDWTYPPFAPVVADGYIYGRGVLDDKGPLLAALYGLKALTELGFKPRKTVRVIMGCNEETGMLCMEHYLSKFAPPSCGFTPDASWPLIIGEKGILQYTLVKKWPPQPVSGPTLLSLDSGLATNVVPAQAEARLRDVVLLDELPEGISAATAGRETLVRASGRAAHGSTPEFGDNALTKLLRFLDGLEFGPAPARDFVAAAARLFADDCYGSGLGLDGEDSHSRTTHAPTVCHIGAGEASVRCDMRFLLSRSSEYYLPLIRQAAAGAGLELGEYSLHEPLWLGEDHPLIGQLLDSYRQVTGDQREPLVIGGGTYAKMFPNFLAFGPEDPDEPSQAHQADERVHRSKLVEAARIYARALYALAK